MSQTKFCHRCQTAKPLDRFAKASDRSDGLQTQCRECRKVQDEARYAALTEEQKLQRRETQTALQLRGRLYIWRHLQAHPCIDCGETDPIVLQFDHVRGEKLSNVGLLAGYGSSLERLQTEIDKCEVRCGNCHFRKTAVDFGWWKCNMQEPTRL